MAQNSQWNPKATGGGPAIRLQSDVPSNEQLVRGLIGTLMSLASTLLQAIDDGGVASGGLTSERALQQSLTPIHDHLRQLLQFIESQESQPEPSVRGATVGMPSFRCERRPTTAPSKARYQVPTVTSAAAARHSFTPLAASTISKPGTTTGNLQLPARGESIIDSGHVTDHLTSGVTAESHPSFVVPSSWREIANASELLAELQDVVEKEKKQVNQRARTLSADRRPTLPGSSRNTDSWSMVKEAAHREGHTTEKQHQMGPTTMEQFARSLMLPPRGQATFSVRETNNCALPDGTFQRTTKTIAGSDASVLTNYQQQQQQQHLMSTPLTAFDCCGRANVTPSAPPAEDKTPEQSLSIPVDQSEPETLEKQQQHEQQF